MWQYRRDNLICVEINIRHTKCAEWKRVTINYERRHFAQSLQRALDISNFRPSNLSFLLIEAELQTNMDSRCLLSQVRAGIIYCRDPICKSAGATKLQHKNKRANEVLFPACQQAATIMFIRFPWKGFTFSQICRRTISPQRPALAFRASGLKDRENDEFFNLWLKIYALLHATWGAVTLEDNLLTPPHPCFSYQGNTVLGIKHRPPSHTHTLWLSAIHFR